MQEINFIFGIAVLIMSVVIHEVSHGQMAYMLGDPTAKHAGRLTLNPMSHLDLFGSILLPLLLFLSNSGFLVGWAKPVPYNPYNLKNQRWGAAIVALAGPGVNIIIAVVFGVILRLANFVPQSLLASFFQISLSVVFINLLLAVFNLMPIPPLDGSKILFALLPYKWQKFQMFLEQWGIFILIFFIIFVFGRLFPLIQFLFRLIAGI